MARARKAERIIRTAASILEQQYRTPRLGNKRNPVSELVFIILSARTHGRNHEATYRALRRAFPTWEEVRDAGTRRVSEVIRYGGLSRIKAAQIVSALRKLTSDFGDLSGRPLRAMGTTELERYLYSLPGVGLKTARCVMMYSLDRPVFPVDTHCRRLFEHLGLVRERLRFEYAQDPLQEMVPEDIRHVLHVNAVAHGRAVCIPGAERCDLCVISHLCGHRRKREKKR